MYDSDDCEDMNAAVGMLVSVLVVAAFGLVLILI